MTRKGFFAGLVIGLLAALLSPQVAQRESKALALPGFPTFTYQGIVIDPTLNPSRYPTGETIFPSIISTAGRVSSPLGAYYLYYAPHEQPGQIFLAYSNSIHGPWTEYGSGPIISNVWSPYYNVSHVSSPYAFWNADENKLFLYFHGENNATRLATSTDGIHFAYDSQVISCGTFGFGSNCEVSYAKVFTQTISGKNNKYVMVLMGLNGTSTGRSIMLAWSNDGRNWTGQSTPLVTPQGAEGSDISGATLFRWNGCMCIAYHGSSGDMYVAEVGAAFDHQNHLGMLYSDPSDERAAAPSFISVNGTTYMFYEQGPRLSAKIAYAVEGGTQPEMVILDNTSPSGVTFDGTWTPSTSQVGYYGSNYIHDGNVNKNGSTAIRWTPNLSGGTYRVYARWTDHANRATNVPYTVVYNGGSTVVSMNQQKHGGAWMLLGTFNFAPGTGGYVRMSNNGTNGFVVADAILFEKQ